MSKQEYTPKRKWRIECTEEKLRLMANMFARVGDSLYTGRCLIVTHIR